MIAEMNHLTTINKLDKSTVIPKINRFACRGVIYQNNKLLMIYLKATNEYKFPGGGIEANESKVVALKREVLEESGRTISKVISSLGYIDQINIDINNEDDIFHMRSYYYRCDITKDIENQNLSGYEIELGFTPVWVSVDQAIKVNENRIKNTAIYNWTARELYMLNYLKEVL
ncbi:MAG: NUDIX domain-containing protein [Candidatus Izemoplasma sp.]